MSTVNFTITAQEVKSLSYQEQVMVVLLELLDRLVMGEETLARVNYVIADLFEALPWQEMSADSVRVVADEVARYGINRLPGFVGDPGEADGSEK